MLPVSAPKQLEVAPIPPIILSVPLALVGVPIEWSLLLTAFPARATALGGVVAVASLALDGTILCRFSNSVLVSVPLSLVRVLRLCSPVLVVLVVRLPLPLRWLSRVTLLLAHRDLHLLRPPLGLLCLTPLIVEQLRTPFYDPVTPLHPSLTLLLFPTRVLGNLGPRNLAARSAPLRILIPLARNRLKKKHDALRRGTQRTVGSTHPGRSKPTSPKTPPTALSQPSRIHPSTASLNGTPTSSLPHLGSLALSLPALNSCIRGMESTPRCLWSMELRTLAVAWWAGRRWHIIARWQTPYASL